MEFDEAFDALIGNEGRYSNDPADPGGETMWGITVAVAREAGWAGAMIDLPRDAGPVNAKNIYYHRYWLAAHCDELAAPARFPVLEAAVQDGVGAAIKILQRAAGVNPDGEYGPLTAAAVARIEPARARDLVLAGQLDHYTECENWPHDGRGWVHRVANNLRRNP
jgi:lysozyme family protein